MKENKFYRLNQTQTINFYFIVYSTIPCYQIFAYLMLAEKAAHSSSTGQDFQKKPQVKLRKLEGHVTSMVFSFKKVKKQ